MTLATMAAGQQLWAAPSDPFGGANNYETAAPKPAEISDGEYGVAEERGAATFTYPLAVPPGRANMAPSLRLSYSSSAPLRGGVAAGFSLDIPEIEVDPQAGRTDTPAYRSSLGGQARLVQVADVGVGYPTYRAEYDASFTRYEHVVDIDGADFWRARTSSGMVYEFRQRVGSQVTRLTLS